MVRLPTVDDLYLHAQLEITNLKDEIENLKGEITSYRWTVRRLEREILKLEAADNLNTENIQFWADQWEQEYNRFLTLKKIEDKIRWFGTYFIGKITNLF